jgi:hypothetical protein
MISQTVWPYCSPDFFPFGTCSKCTSLIKTTSFGGQINALNHPTATEEMFLSWKVKLKDLSYKEIILLKCKMYNVILFKLVVNVFPYAIYSLILTFVCSKSCEFPEHKWNS